MPHIEKTVRKDSVANIDNGKTIVEFKNWETYDSVVISMAPEEAAEFEQNEEYVLTIRKRTSQP